MVFGQKDIEEEMEIRARSIENVMELVYQGSLLTWENDCNKEIKRRIARATGVMAGFKTTWNSKHISTETKISIIRTCVMSMLLYACETWTLRKIKIKIYCRRLKGSATGESCTFTGIRKSQTWRCEDELETRGTLYNSSWKGSSACLDISAGWRTSDW